MANTICPWARVYKYNPSHMQSEVCCGVPQLPYREDLREAEFATWSGVQTREQVGAVDQLVSAMDMTSGEHASLASVQVVCARKDVEIYEFMRIIIMACLNSCLANLFSFEGTAVLCAAGMRPAA